MIYYIIRNDTRTTLAILKTTEAADIVFTRLMYTNKYEHTLELIRLHADEFGVIDTHIPLKSYSVESNILTVHTAALV